MTHRPRIHFVLLLESALSPATILVAFVARPTYQSTRIAFTLCYPRIKGAVFAFDSSFPNNDLRYRSIAPGDAIAFDNA